MFSSIERMFGKKKESIFPLFENPSFKNAIEFNRLTPSIYEELKEKLVLLSIERRTFKVEPLLKNKQVFKYKKVGEMLEEIWKDLENNFLDSTTEFADEPIGFVYYLGEQLQFSNAVEIVQQVYYKERNDIGNIYNSLVVKFNKGKYYYWKW
jgi:hypothetical protein